MKKEKGIGPKGRKPPQSKRPPLRGATGGKHSNKPPKNPDSDYWLSQIPQIFAEKNLRQSA